MFTEMMASGSGGGSGISYIDFNNLIHSQKIAEESTSVTYTATQDCYVFFALRIYGMNLATLKVNNKKIDSVANSSNTNLEFHMTTPAKTGDVVTLTMNNNKINQSNMYVYGLSNEVVAKP